jgi:hypothetical protein
VWEDDLLQQPAIGSECRGWSRDGFLHIPGGGIHSTQILHYAKLSVLDAFNLIRVCGNLKTHSLGCVGRVEPKAEECLHQSMGFLEMNVLQAGRVGE